MEDAVEEREAQSETSRQEFQTDSRATEGSGKRYSERASCGRIPDGTLDIGTYYRSHPKDAEDSLQTAFRLACTAFPGIFVSKTDTTGKRTRRKEDTGVERNNVADTAKKRAQLKATFCFLDESGYSERPVMRCTWGKRGVTPVVRSTGSWKNISATGIVATTEHMKRVRALCTFTRGSVRKEDTVRTLKHLALHIKGTIALVWDGLAQHRALVVRDFLHTHRKRFVMVERFPAYAPELNPQEYIWASSKTKDFAGYVPEEESDLLHRARKSIKRIQRSPDILRGALRASGLFHMGGS